MKKGKVYLVGAGVGDIGLFTLRGKELLEIADVVIYDALMGASILSFARDEAELIYVGKRGGNHTMTQDNIDKLILDKALEGNQVVRLKGGDPFMFGRGGEELELLIKHNVEFEVVSGITSPIAAPACAGIPVTHRDFVSSLHIVTGHTKESEGSSIDFASLVKLNGTIAFLMGISSLEKIMTGLSTAGMEKTTPVAIIENGSRGNQRTTIATVDTIVEVSRDKGVKSPAIILVGQVCSLGERYNWKESLPLFGKRVVVTRPKSLNSTFCKKLQNLGAEVIELPAISTVPMDFTLDLAEINSAEVIAFTSARGVECFFDKLKADKIDIRKLSHIKFAVVGSSTRKSLENYGIIADFMPSKYDGTSLGQVIETKGKVLIYRALEGAMGLCETLKEKGIEYKDIAVYKTIYNKANQLVINELKQGVDYLCFTSASTVIGCINAVEDVDVKEIPALCIGEMTYNEAKKQGFVHLHMSTEATVNSMIDYITQEA